MPRAVKQRVDNLSPAGVSEFDFESIAPATSVSPSPPIAIPAAVANLNTAFDIDEPPADDGGSCTGGSSSSSRQQRLRRRPRSELSGQTTTESSDSDNPSKRFKKVTWLKEARSVRWLLVSFVRWWF